MSFHEFISFIFAFFLSCYVLFMVIGNLLRIFYSMDKYY